VLTWCKRYKQIGYDLENAGQLLETDNISVLLQQAFSRLSQNLATLTHENNSLHTQLAQLSRAHADTSQSLLAVRTSNDQLVSRLDHIVNLLLRLVDNQTFGSSNALSTFTSTISDSGGKHLEAVVLVA